MSKIDAYDTYVIYLAVRTHFNSETYDFFKYNGKVSASRTSFDNRRDRYNYQRLSKAISAEDMPRYIAASMALGSKWSGDLLSDPAKEIFTEMKAYEQACSYRLSNELDSALQECGDMKSLFKLKDGTSPLIELYCSGKLTNYSVAVLSKLVPFANKYDEVLGKDDWIWSKMKIECIKLAPFLHIDLKKVAETVKSKM